MKARHRAALVAALTALGCAGQPGPNQLLYRELEGQFATAATVSLRVNLSLPERELQALAKKWQVADVNLLRVKLLRDDGAGFVDTGLTQDLSRKVAPIATGASFNQLAAGKRYRVDVGAWGEVGGSAATALLNAQNPATADFDFSLTPGQDLGASKSATVAIRLDDVAFSGTANVTPSGVPAGASTLEAQLWVQGAQDPVATQSLVSTASTIAFGGLRAGPDYETKLKALDANQAVLAEIASTSFRFDPNAAQLEQVVAFGLTLPGASAAPSVAPSVAPSPYLAYDAGSSPTYLAVDSQGNLWVPSSGRVAKFNSSGSLLLTYSVNGAFAASVDAADNVWVTVSLNNGHTTKLNSLGQLLGTFSVGSAGRVGFTSTGQVWVPEYGNAAGTRIRKLASNGSVLGIFTAGAGPFATQVDAQDNVWVSNAAAGANSVTKLASNGSILGTYAVGTRPNDLAIDSQGRVWVANAGGSNVTRLNSLGSVLSTVGISSPRGLDIDAQGNVWVAANAAVDHKFASSGSLLATFTVGGASWGMAVSTAGEAWVTRNLSAGKLIRILTTM